MEERAALLNKFENIDKVATKSPQDEAKERNEESKESPSMLRLNQRLNDASVLL